MQISETTVGVDVAQAVLDVWVHPSRESWQVSNDPSGADDLALALRSHGPSLVVVEATGGLEDRLVASLASAGLPNRHRQSASGARLCPSYRPVGQDGPSGCSDFGRVRRCRTSAGTGIA